MTRRPTAAPSPLAPSCSIWAAAEASPRHFSPGTGACAWWRQTSGATPADALATSARLGLGARDVLPVHADACDLPFAEEAFDAVTCIDAYNYFGCDESYLGQRLFAAQRNVRVERIRDLSCNDEAWRDWVACDNPYAAGDRRAIEAGALAWLTTTEVVLRRL